MLTTKETMVDIINKQPEDSSYEEIIKELAFSKMIQKGIKDSEENRTVSNNEMEQRINSWQK